LTWLLAVSTVMAPMRFARKRCSSGCTVRSLVATMYQLGFDLQAVPSTFWLTGPLPKRRDQFGGVRDNDAAKVGITLKQKYER
jgi:hypothetical protein